MNVIKTYIIKKFKIGISHMELWRISVSAKKP